MKYENKKAIPLKKGRTERRDSSAYLQVKLLSEHEIDHPKAEPAFGCAKSQQRAVRQRAVGREERAERCPDPGRARQACGRRRIDEYEYVAASVGLRV